MTSVVMRGLAGSAMVLTTWCLLVLGLVGIGLMVDATIRRSRPRLEDLFGCFWIGLALVVFYLHVWHFFLPVRWPALLGPAAFGLLGWSVVRVEGDGLPRRALLGWGVGVLLAGLWLANRAAGPITAGDSGMYHVPSVTWIKEYPLVPGLGNLHGRLAFNNANLLFAAFLDVGPWRSLSFHLVNGLLLFVLVLRGAVALLRLGGTRGDGRMLGFYHVTLLAPAALLAVRPRDISSLTNDSAVAVLMFFAAGWLLEGFTGGARPIGERRSPGIRWVALTAVLTLAVTFKLTAAAFAGSAALFVIAWTYQALRAKQPSDRVVLTWMGVIGVGLGLAWVGRGIMLSGYPLYPAGLGGLPVHWTVPREQLEAERAWITHFAQTLGPSVPYHGPDQARWGWFAPWLAKVWGWDSYRWLLAYPALLLVPIAGVWGAGVLRSRRRRDAVWRATWLPLLPAGAALAFWFVSAPRPEFGFGLVWIVVALLGAHAASLLGEGRSARQFLTATGAFVVAISALPVLLSSRPGPADEDAARPGSAVGTLLVSPPRDGWLHPMPLAETTTYTTGTGLVLRVPVADNRCWEAPLPCTPHPAGNLRLRSPDGLRAGFTTDGQWMPERWPNPRSNFLAWWRQARGRGR